MGNRATTASLDHRVARVESDLGALASRFDDFRDMVKDSLARIEKAVTAPSPADAANAVMLADLARRMTDTESATAKQQQEITATATQLTATKAQLGTVAKILSGVGVGGVLTFMGLVAYAVSQTGKPL